MMWNYLAGGLLAGATVVLYDGSATYPGTDALWRLIRPAPAPGTEPERTPEPVGS